MDLIVKSIHPLNSDFFIEEKLKEHNLILYLNKLIQLMMTNTQQICIENIDNYIMEVIGGNLFLNPKEIATSLKQRLHKYRSYF